MNDDRFAALAAGLDLVLWEAELPGRRFRFVSPYAETLLGYAKDEWCMPGFWQAHLHPDDRGFAVTLDAAHAAESDRYEIEYRMVHAGGHAVFVRDLVVVRFNEDGEAIGLSGVMIDVTSDRALNHALTDSEHRFRAVMEQVPNISVQGYDPQRRVVFWNSASERLYGYTASEVRGRLLEELIIPEPMRADVVRLHSHWLQTGEAIPAGELELQRKDGSLVSVFSSHVMTHNRYGEPEMYCIDVDLTDIKRAEAALRDSEARFRLTVENAPVGIAILALDGRILQVNPRFCAISGYGAVDLLATSFAALTENGAREAYQNEVDACLSGAQQSFNLEARLLHKYGHELWISATVSMMRNTNGEPEQLICAIEDVTEQRASKARFEWLAHHDPLTDLPNRTLLRDRLQQAMARALRAGKRAALMFLDLDRFKNINDSLGHAFGDQVLRSVAARLRTCVRDTDTVARLGGDEFLIVLECVENEQDVGVVARKIVDKLSLPLDVQSQTLSTGASIGIALYPEDGVDVDTLLKNADSAMYHAKDSGRNAFRFFTEAMNLSAIDRLRMENALRQALEFGELSLHYQPQVELTTTRVLGVEALLRWNNPVLGNVSPARFIPVAEESGLIVPIGEWVLGEACAQARRWRDEGIEALTVAVNLSALPFRRTDIVGKVRAALDRHCIPAGMLELELTESLLMHNAEEVLRTMNDLKALGVKLSIDDFGTGYSSLSYLKRVTVDRLKIDRSFVNDVADDPDDAAIVRAIIQLGRSLKLDVIAEGVETPSQLDFLTMEGCHSAQGFFFARPMPAADLDGMLHSGLAAGGAQNAA